MPVIIASKSRFSGSVTPSDLNVETTVVEITSQDDDYMVEGYLDLSNLQSGENMVVREYISVDGYNYRLFTAPVTFRGVLSDPIIRLHTKTLLYNMKYKVTITQTSGTVRSIPYAFILEVMGTI